MATKTKLNIFRLIKRLEELKNKPYSNTYMADKAGLSRVTVNSLVSGDTNRIDLATIDKLIDFFAAEGMPIDAGDLFTVTPDPCT